MEFRTIPGFSYYEVNIYGEVRSVDRIIKCKTGYKQLFHGKTIKWNINKNRKNETSVHLLNDNGVRRRIKVSHCVAMAFPEICGELFDGCEVDHIDTNRLNNNAYNLRVTDKTGNMNNPTTRKNCSNAWTEERRIKCSQRMKDNNPMCKPGIKHQNSVKVGYYDENNNLIVFDSIAEASRITGVNHSGIQKCVRGIINKSGGLIWKCV